jgi:TonB family protein
MSRLVVYKPAPRTQICAAVGASIAIHVGAIALATTQPVATRGGVIGEATIVTLEQSNELAAEETPPPVEIPLPDPPAMEQSVFTDATPPTMRRKPNVRTAMRPRAKVGPPGVSSIGPVQTAAINAPRPDYPYEARRQHATGSGVAILHVDQTSGFVTDVSMAQSTGNRILDEATLSAFKRWRFKPGTMSIVRTPITFKLTGAEY